MFPVFRVREAVPNQGRGAVGTVTETTPRRENWIGDNWIGFLKSDAKLIAGRWHRRGDLWEFAPEDANNLDVVLEQPEWEVLDGYWGERAEIVLDPTRGWHRARFTATDAIRTHGPDGVWLRPVTDADAGSPATVARAYPASPTDAEDDTASAEVVEAAWDHEHCTICWATLGRGGQVEGFVSEQRTWVCERCYIDFVEQRSLAFIPSA